MQAKATQKTLERVQENISKANALVTLAGIYSKKGLYAYAANNFRRAESAYKEAGKYEDAYQCRLKWFVAEMYNCA